MTKNKRRIFIGHSSKGYFVKEQGRYNLKNSSLDELIREMEFQLGTFVGRRDRYDNPINVEYSKHIPEDGKSIINNVVSLINKFRESSNNELFLQNKLNAYSNFIYGINYTQKEQNQELKSWEKYLDKEHKEVSVLFR
ncbi:hypothetical protein KAT80_01885 [Candidatus Pacearchaeota archaeon]|nr:hypothetical protein [Candidatus Pacearchaeota archaeon]